MTTSSLDPTSIAAQLLGTSTCHIAAIADYAPNNDSDRHCLQPQVIESFLAMQQAAANDGIDCQIISSYRSFSQQLSIWDRKWQGALPILDADHKVMDILQMDDLTKMHAILRWSALPGGSRHHWGTDFDVVDRKTAKMAQVDIQLVDAEYAQNGVCGALHHWLSQHAKTYDFYQPYATYTGGIGIEPWHYSYQPLAQKMSQHLSVECIAAQIKTVQICGQSIILDNIEDIFNRYILNQSSQGIV